MALKSLKVLQTELILILALTLKIKMTLKYPLDVMKNNQSTTKLSIQNLESKEWYIPYVIEPSAGVDRGVFALLNEAYKEEDLVNGNKRIVLSLKPHLSPLKRP